MQNVEFTWKAKKERISEKKRALKHLRRHAPALRPLIRLALLREDELLLDALLGCEGK